MEKQTWKRRRKKGKGKRADLRCLIVLLAAVEVAGRGGWGTVAHGASPPSSSLSLLCFFFYFVFLLLFLSFSLFSALFFFSFFSFSLPPFFLVLSPVFIGKIGEREVGSATVQPPQKQPEGHVPSFSTAPW